MRRRGIRGSNGPTPSWFINPCSNCSRTCAQTASRPTSFRRRHRVHAAVDGKGLRHPARTGLRRHHQDEVRNARRQAGVLRLPAIDFIDDKAGKPVGINKYIGRQPIAAFGNSDGDQQMLEWTQRGSGARLMISCITTTRCASSPMGRSRRWHVQRCSDGRSEGKEMDGHQHEERLKRIFVPSKGKTAIDSPRMTGATAH